MQVFLTYCNSDPTEGRGVMTLREAFLHEGNAIDYIESQPDEYNRVRTWNDGRYGDWEIRPLEVIESLEELPAAMLNAERKRRIRTARSKLTRTERIDLGIEGDVGATRSSIPPVQLVNTMTAEEVANDPDMPRWPDRPS